MRSRVRTRALLAAFLCSGLLACSSTDPGDQPVTVSNKSDDFSFQLKDSPDFSGQYHYLWTNTGTTAAVNVSQAPASGIGTIEIRDADNALVHTGDLLTTGNSNTSPGRAGTWTIDIVFVRAAGALSLTVRKS